RPDSAPASAELPGLVYAHGGGFVFGNLDSHDVLCAQLAIEAGITVVALDYRLAPEAPFPAAFDDVVAGLKRVHDSGASAGLDPTKRATGGAGAGGNLAAAAAIWARDHGGPKLRMQMLAYPVTDAVARAESYRLFEDGYGLNAVTMEWFFDHYTPDKNARADWRVSPLRAQSLAGLPPPPVVTPRYDNPRAQGRAPPSRPPQGSTPAPPLHIP